LQTYTHALFGATIGFVFLPHQPALQMALVAGSVAPDLVMVPLYLKDSLQGKIPLSDQGPFTLILKMLSHSLFVSIVCIFTMWTWPPGFYFFFGAFCHQAMDEPTHGIGEAKIPSETCFWPLHRQLEWFRHSIGIWEYRKSNAEVARVGKWAPLYKLIPKPFELITCMILLTITLYASIKSDDLKWYKRAVVRCYYAVADTCVPIRNPSP
jgi:hypothetical protein